MGNRLKDNLNSRYIEAANKLSSKQARRRIVAYVESYDDIYFWRTVLSRFENETRYFEVMLPSHKKLDRGKKAALSLPGLGPAMIACVDADYDYLLQGHRKSPVLCTLAARLLCGRDAQRPSHLRLRGLPAAI